MISHHWLSNGILQPFQGLEFGLLEAGAVVSVLPFPVPVEQYLGPVTLDEKANYRDVSSNSIWTNQRGKVTFS